MCCQICRFSKNTLRLISTIRKHKELISRWERHFSCERNASMILDYLMSVFLFGLKKWICASVQKMQDGRYGMMQKVRLFIMADRVLNSEMYYKSKSIHLRAVRSICGSILSGGVSLLSGS